MTDKECKSMSSQLAYCTNANKQQEQPMNLIFTGLGPKIVDQLEKSNYQNWQIQSFKEEGEKKNNYLDIFDNCLPEGLKKEQLVYLTADSPNEISQLDKNACYIIGGIVDRNRHTGITFKKAQAQGIGHAKLPIGEHLALQSSCVLTVNHVFDIMATQFNKDDWKETLNKVIPVRKHVGYVKGAV